jgi:hypothetical protein
MKDNQVIFKSMGRKVYERSFDDLDEIKTDLKLPKKSWLRFKFK